jgi:hypothetical protein
MIGNVGPFSQGLRFWVALPERVRVGLLVTHETKASF